MNATFIFLFLRIQTIGVMAIAMSRAREGPVRLNTLNTFFQYFLYFFIYIFTSKTVVMKLMSSTSMLNRQSVMKPVVREINSPGWEGF